MTITIPNYLIEHKGTSIAIKLSILKKFGAGTLVPFYGTEVPTPWVKKALNLMAVKGTSNNKKGTIR